MVIHQTCFLGCYDCVQTVSKSSTSCMVVILSCIIAHIPDQLQTARRSFDSLLLQDRKFPVHRSRSKQQRTRRTKERKRAGLMPFLFSGNGTTRSAYVRRPQATSHHRWQMPHFSDDVWSVCSSRRSAFISTPLECTGLRNRHSIVHRHFFSKIHVRT